LTKTSKTENGFFEILIERKTGKHLNNLWKTRGGKSFEIKFEFQENLQSKKWNKNALLWIEQT
jgi:hypothetical protein